MKLSSGRNLLGSLIIVEVSCGVCIITGVCSVCSLLNHILSLLLLSSAERQNQEQWNSVTIFDYMSNKTCSGQQTPIYHRLSAWNRGIQKYLRCSPQSLHSSCEERKHRQLQHSVRSAKREGSTGGMRTVRGIRASYLQVISNQATGWTR